MKILAIESASITASCAVSQNDIILGEYSLSHKKTHSEKLMPLIESLLSDMEINLDDIDVIAISEGPGSYTGLRIGAAIGKSLAFAKNIPIANVPTMKSLASNIYFTDKYIVPVMDGKAGRVYTGIYKWVNKRLTTIKEQFPANIEDLIEMLNQINEPIILNGDGSVNYKSIFDEMMKIKPLFSPNQFNYLKASSLVSIGYEIAKSQETMKAFDFSPKYLRLSQAERNIK